MKLLTAPKSVLSLLLSFVWVLDCAADDEFSVTVDRFTQKHCAECHDAREGEGDFRVDLLPRSLGSAKDVVDWQMALDLVKAGEMPPEESDRPTADEVREFTEAVENEVRKFAQSSSDTDVPEFRRLSRTELDNTVRDLLGTRLKLSRNLPADPVVGGFDSMAATMGQSTEHIRVLQRNARAIASDVVIDGDNPNADRHYPRRRLRHGYSVKRQRDELVLWSSRNRTYVAWPDGFVAQRTGVYRVSITAYQVNNIYELRRQGKTIEAKDDIVKNALRRPLPEDRLRQVAISAMQAPVNGNDAATVGGRQVGITEVGTTMSTVSIDCELVAGEGIFVNPVDCPRLVSRPIADVDSERMYVGEMLHLKEVRVEGPLVEWPSRVTSILLDQQGELSTKGLGKFLSRAFRQPVGDDVVTLYESLFRSVTQSGGSVNDALRQVVEAVLCSPRFLYVRSGIGGVDEADQAWTLASRLSYFLWNTLPDDELRALAATGDLLREDVLRGQVARMIADPRSDGFVIDFAGQWLGLRRVGAMMPDPKLYPEYDSELERAIRQESEALFRHLLTNNSKITDFIDPGYAMLNERLARHYGVDDVSGPEFRKVVLPEGHPRGGLLGHASMLTTTSNGTRTSPVIRGVWILENLLHSPPPPPPADVEPIEPDTRGASSIREMLAKHRDVDSCRECHRRIDPWGFGLENFNAVGAWREHYGKGGKGKAVDATGRMASGESFDGVVEMRGLLMQREERFTHALASKLLAYALGHPATVKERVAIDEIVSANAHSGGRFADLITEICTSQVFRGSK